MEDRPASPEPREEPQGAAPVPQDQTHSSGSPLANAIELVTKIIGELRSVVEEMELVLEYLEDAERQQLTDERQIKMLESRLDALHRQFGRGGHRPRHPEREPKPAEPAPEPEENPESTPF